MWTDAAIAQLSSWGLSPDAASTAGLFETLDAGALLEGVPHRPGIVLPYYGPAGALLQINGRPFGRVRWLDVPKAMFGGKVKAPRYGQPPGTGIQVYFPPQVEWATILSDPRRPIIITEGEVKALVATLNGYLCIALGGVYSFTEDKVGSLVEVLAQAEWKGRPVAIVYDSDAAVNPKVLAAEARLVEELGTRRGADVRIVRLPDEGGKKVGLDDFLTAHGADALDALIAAAPNLGQLDSKIIALNRTCAWIEQEGSVYDLETTIFIPRADFINGSRFSTLTHIVTSGPKAQPKTIRVAEQWLKHPHAQRYAQVQFRPGENAVLDDPKGRMLNLWTGWDTEPGDVGPWLRLGEFLFSRDPDPEIRTLPLRLTAYKAQHPAVKIPLALVMTGPQGSGKTMWVDSIRDAFAPYSAAIEPGSLAQDFHPWLEKSVVATINELDVETARRNAQMIMALITDSARQLNDKYRPMRSVNSPTFYYITSNYSGVGAGFTHDDRRVIGIQCPGIGPQILYDDLMAWRRAGGAGPKLMHYLLNYDLKGWTPPNRAPMTAAKKLAYREGMTPIQLLAGDMRESSFNTILYWIDLAAQYASTLELGGDPIRASEGRAIREGTQHIQVRPWYTAEELVTIFPSVLSQVYSTQRTRDFTPGQLSRQLRDSGIPFLVNRDNPEGFLWQGRMRQYLVISAFEDWQEPITQTDFDRNMRNWPTFGQAKQMAGKK